MSFDQLDVLLIIALIAGAVYCIWFSMEHRHDATLPDSRILYRNNAELRKCKDPQGYLAYILPRLRMTGFMLLAAGLLLLVQTALKLNFPAITLLTTVLPLIPLVWYVIMLSKGADRFW